MFAVNQEIANRMKDKYGEQDIFALNYGYVEGDSYQVADDFYRQADRHLSQDKYLFYKNHNIDRRG